MAESKSNAEFEGPWIPRLTYFFSHRFVRSTSHRRSSSSICNGAAFRRYTGLESGRYTLQVCYYLLLRCKLPSSHFSVFGTNVNRSVPAQLILYFMAGLQVSAAQFFVFILFTFIANLAMLALFRSLASSNRHEPKATMWVENDPIYVKGLKSSSLSHASRFAGLLILVVAIYVGYTIPRPQMKVWFRWLSYAQPVSFAFEALLANECKLQFSRATE